MYIQIALEKQANGTLDMVIMKSLNPDFWLKTEIVY